jgi:predicted AlkP superfamily pyrophosphatase or phosphodiesterase
MLARFVVFSIEPPLIVVSLDGFRGDYLLRNYTPTLQKLSTCGVQAKYMRSAFPTKTFPNHYTLVTVRTFSHHTTKSNLNSI